MKPRCRGGCNVDKSKCKLKFTKEKMNMCLMVLGVSC